MTSLSVGLRMEDGDVGARSSDDLNYAAGSPLGPRLHRCPECRSPSTRVDLAITGAGV